MDKFDIECYTVVKGSLHSKRARGQSAKKIGKTILNYENFSIFLGQGVHCPGFLAAAGSGLDRLHSFKNWSIFKSYVSL